MTVKYHNVEQGTDEWAELRCGLLTASEMKLIVTPTLKVANNDKQKLHLYELLAQRINNYTEPQYYNDAMLRGHEDEIYAKEAYIAPVEECGFITNDKWGFTLGFSPDGLVGEDGLIEIKSRIQKHQTKTILEDVVPSEYMLQIQTGLLVSDRKWVDFVSYCAGMPMFIKRVYPDFEIQTAITEAAILFHAKMEDLMEEYDGKAKDMIKTERREEEEMVV